jgi:hypothetical protein
VTRLRAARLIEQLGRFALAHPERHEVPERGGIAACDSGAKGFRERGVCREKGAHRESHTDGMSAIVVALLAGSRLFAMAWMA